MMKSFRRLITSSSIRSVSNNNNKKNPFNFRSRSHLTEMLWKDRYAKGKLGSNQNLSEVVYPASKAENLQPRRMRDSYCEVIMPFRTDLDLREDYVNHFRGIRFGKILEDLDAMAATIAHQHCSYNMHDMSPVMIVTAGVDRIDLLHPLRPDLDLKICGHVSYVGTSSMEVTLRVESLGDPNSKEPIDQTGKPLPESTKWTPICLCRFTMVARDSTSHGPAKVNELIAETEQEKAIIATGAKRKATKMEMIKKDLRKLPPEPEERLIIHNLWLEASKFETRQGELIINKHDNVTFPSETQQQIVRIMHPQERNIHSSIFGGYLMREAFELAYTTAMLFIGGRPWTVALDDIAFAKPVPIGSILFLTSQVVFAEGNPHRTFQVKVSAEVSRDTGATRELTNIFYITFAGRKDENGNMVKVNKLLPQSYTDSMEYLLGKRRKDHGIEYKNNQLREFLEYKIS